MALIPPSTKTLAGIRAHADAIERGDGRYEIQMLCRMVHGLADIIEGLEVVPSGRDHYVIEGTHA